MLPLAALALLALSAPPPAAAGDAPPAAARPETPLQLAARLASRAFPAARWRLGEARQADFTYDGQPDLALLGSDGPALLLVVVEGPISARSRVLGLRFPTGPGAAGDLCGAPAAVQANSERPDPAGLSGLDEAARVRILEAGDAGGLGLVLIHAGPSGYCQPFHLLYDGSQLTWWQPPPDPPLAGALAP